MSLNFNSAAFDAATRTALEQIANRGTDCFGDPLFIERPVGHDRIIACLSQEPMRLRQLAVRTQARRGAVEAACDSLIARGAVTLDSEAFYSLNKPEIH